MDIKKEAENIIKNVDKEDVKNVVNKALGTKVADNVIDKINEKTSKVDVSKEDIKNVVNTVLK
ncbi:MAG: hypothetical protein K5776_10670 [Lachnospiraceae bacterium]|nr:hypothetical protein [Lachnospiraceae bacterium]